MEELTKNQINGLVAKLSALKAEIAKVIVGQETTVDYLLVTFMAGGHGLLEGVPGLAKTLMIRTLAQAIDLSFNRIQFTPDLMPSDIVGTEVLEEDHASGKKFFKFNKGPVFANIVLADEINRTPPKTQAALLEAMQEFEVTYAGETYELDKPFFILATQNPIEQAGTFPLPEAQLDRFLLYIQIAYPTEQDELNILKNTTGTKGESVKAILTAQEIIQLQSLVRQIPISDDLVAFVNSIVRSTRPETTNIDFVKGYVRWGAGPRAGQAMILTAKAIALLRGRFGVTKADIMEVAFPVLRHRILINFKAEAEHISSDDVTEHLVNAIELPKNQIN